MEKQTLIERLNEDLAGELSAIVQYGDKGLVVQLEDMVRDESAHLEETERILREWPL
jgi:bacterioferritin (cytochrome b1)